MRRKWRRSPDGLWLQPFIRRGGKREKGRRRGWDGSGGPQARPGEAQEGEVREGRQKGISECRGVAVPRSVYHRADGAMTWMAVDVLEAVWEVEWPVRLVPEWETDWEQADVTAEICVDHIDEAAGARSATVRGTLLLTVVGTVNDRRSVVYETRYWPFELTVRQPVEEMDTGPAHQHPCRSDPFPWSVHESRIVADRWRAEVIKAAGQQGGPPSRFNELMLRVTGRLARWTRQLFPWGPVGGDHR